MNREICGECKYHKPSWETGKLRDYSCTNEDSDYYTDYTEYTDTCEEWEQRGVE